MKIAVLGIGNILLGDEGVGVQAIEAIMERYDLPESVELIDGGTMGLDLLPFIENRDKVLIIDAVNIGKPAGTLVTIEGDDIPRFLNLKISVHQIGLPEMLAAANIMGIMPEEICLVGIQPKTFRTGLDLSDEIAGKLDALIDAVLGRLEEWGVVPKLKNRCPA